METLFWTKGLFGNQLKLSQGKELIGNINWTNFFSAKAHASIYGRRFILNRDFMLSKIDIYDGNNQALLGSIMINLFNPRSDLILNGKRFELEIKNFWQSRWSWKFNGSEIITYQSNEFLTQEKGQIGLISSMNEEVEVLLLLGLFVRNQFVLFMVLLLIFFLVVII